MIKRNYNLYVNSEGSYEIIPSGWSFGAFFLQMFWAFAYGVFAKYVLFFIPLVALSILIDVLPTGSEFLQVISVTYLFGVFYGYFPYMAFSWHEKNLFKKGYKLQATVRASSSKEALHNYAQDVEV